jgi:hypothetical protein
METAAARATWARELAELLHAIDRWFPDLAERLAAEGTYDMRTLEVALRREWRKFRQDQARQQRRHADAAETLVEPTEPEPDDERSTRPPGKW